MTKEETIEQLCRELDETDGFQFFDTTVYEFYGSRYREMISKAYDAGVIKGTSIMFWGDED